MPELNKKLLWRIWFATWVLLLCGLFDRVFYHYVVALSAAHFVFIFANCGMTIRPFPVQVRFVYLFWVIIGTYVPGGIILMYITTAGLAANLFLKYCPLARVMTLLPWNREEAMSLDLVRRTVLTPPSEGKFKPAAKEIYN